jgi:hypothetical protein
MIYLCASVHGVFVCMFGDLELLDQGSLGARYAAIWCSRRTEDHSAKKGTFPRPLVLVSKLVDLLQCPV